MEDTNSFIYAITLDSHQIYSKNNITKIGSTCNYYDRLHQYKTFCPEFLKSNIKVTIFTLIESELNCYEVDRLINICSTKYKIPFQKYDGTGGTEFYEVDNIEKLRFFLSINDIKCESYEIDVNEIKPSKNYTINITYDEQNKDIIDDQIINDFIEKHNVNDHSLKDFTITNDLNLQSNIMLRDWQKACFDELMNFVDDENDSGVIIAPTGSGKSYLIVFFVLHYIMKYKKNVMIITKRKEIFDVTFEKKVHDMIKSLDMDIDLKVYDCIHARYKKTIFSNKSKYNKIFLLNSDKFISSDEFSDYGKIKFENLGLCIQDECHWSGGEKIYDFLDFIKTKINKIIGFSATPIRPQILNMKRTLDIFGDEEKLNIIYQRGYFDAYLDGDILLPKFKIFQLTKDDAIKEDIVESDSEQINEKRNFWGLNRSGMKKLMKLLNTEIIIKSVYKKVIIWFKTIKNLLTFYEYVCEKKQNYKNLIDIIFYPTFSTSKNAKDQMDELDLMKEDVDQNIFTFKNKRNNAILLAVNRATEGFDDKYVDIAMRVYVAETIEQLSEHQRNGRVMRICPNKTACYYYTAEFIDSDEFKEKLKCQYGDWIKFISEHCTQTRDKKDNRKVNKRLIEIVNHSFELVGKEYEINLRDILSEAFRSNKTKKMNKMKEYIAIKEHLKEYKLKHKDDYNEVAEMDDFLPTEPEEYFGSYWRNWYDYLSIDTREFIQDKDEWIKKVVELKLTNPIDYQQSMEDQIELPEMPQEFYKGLGTFDSEFSKYRKGMTTFMIKKY